MKAAIFLKAAEVFVSANSSWCVVTSLPCPRKQTFTSRRLAPETSTRTKVPQNPFDFDHFETYRLQEFNPFVDFHQGTLELLPKTAILSLDNGMLAGCEKVANEQMFANLQVLFWPRFFVPSGLCASFCRDPVPSSLSWSFTNAAPPQEKKAALFCTK